MIHKLRSFLSTCGRKVNGTITHANPRNLLWASYILVVVAFIVPRYAFFVHYPVPPVLPDSFGYFHQAGEIHDLQWPDCTIRGPGYAALILLCHLMWPNLLSVVAVQSLIALAAALFLVWSVYRAYGRLVVGATFAMVGHLGQPLLSSADLTLLSDSLCTSGMVVFVGLILQALHTKKASYALLCGLVGGFCILTRPASMFLLASVVAAALFMVIHKFSRTTVLSLACPIPAVILVVILYNGFTTGYFGVSVIGSLGMMGNTATFWVTDPSLSPEINRKINRFTETIAEKDRKHLDESWDPYRLHNIYYRYIVRSFYGDQEAEPLVRFPQDRRDPSWPMRSSDVMRSVALPLVTPVWRKAIAGNPVAYLKFVYTNFCHFFADRTSWKEDVYDLQDDLIPQDHGIPTNTFFLSQYTGDVSGLDTLRVERSEGKARLVRVKTVSYRLHKFVSRILARIYQSPLWLIPYFGCLFISGFLVLWSRFRNTEAFVVVLLASMHALAALQACPVALSFPRYSNMTRFLVYLSVFFAVSFVIRSWAGNPASKGEYRAA